MSANTRKPRKNTSSFSKREKMRRPPCRCRNRRSTSLRRWSSSRSYPHGASRICAEAPPARTPMSAQASVARRLPTPRPSTPAAALAGRPGAGAPYGPQAQHGLVPGTARTSPLFKQPRQPDASWWAVLRGTCRGAVDRFVSRPRPSGENLHAGTGQRPCLQLDSDERFLLEVCEHPTEDPGLRPVIHLSVDGMPPPEPSRDSPPLAPLLGNLQDDIEHGQIRDAHLPRLHRQQRRNAFVLRFGQFHPCMIPSFNHLCDQIL